MPPCVITIGNFDGVHRGHQALIAHARACADDARVPLRIWTFEPHPALLLRSSPAPLRLTDIRDKLALLRQAGAHEVHLIEPTPELLARSPREFIQSLVREHGPIMMVEGSNFRFGAQRAGDMQSLRELGAEFGFATQAVEPLFLPLDSHHEAPLSSTLIRQLLAHGRVELVARALGRPYALAGSVVTGHQRGRTLNVPTANLDPGSLVGRALPADGVYAGRARLADDAHWPAAISLGIKPTFHGRTRTLEAHLLGFTGDLYGQRIELTFHRWLRDQMPFPGIETLRSQLMRDVQRVRAHFEGAAA